MFENMKLGKLPVRLDARTLKLAKYIEALFPAPPEHDDSKKLGTLGMMLNDTLGDCTCAAPGHQIQAWTAEAGSQIDIPDSAILKAYEDVGGYNPADPSTDQGAVELDVLNYWRQTGIGGHKISAYATLNPQKTMEIRQAIFYFGGAYIGIELPLTAQNQTIWLVTSLEGDGQPGTWGGHAVCVIAYDKHFVTCITWGQLLKMSWNFFYAYCSEAYAVLSPDIFTPEGKTPEGFDIATLQQDLQQITT